MAVAQRGAAARGAPCATGAAASGCGSRGQKTYLRRLILKVLVCLAVGLCLPGRHIVPEGGFVGPPRAVGRLLRGSSQHQHAAAASAGGGEGEAGKSEEEDAAALRAKVMELEKKLGEQTAQQAAQAPPPQAAQAPPPRDNAALAMAAQREAAKRRKRPVNPKLLAAWEAINEDFGEDFAKVKEGQLELMGGVQMKGANEDGTSGGIYRRKYDLLGASLSGQEAYLKAIRRTVKLAKENKSVQKMVDMMKNGFDGMDRREVARETDKLSKSSPEANIFFNEIMPGVLEDPIADAVGLVLSTIAILVGIVLLFLCLFPPIPPSEE